MNFWVCSVLGRGSILFQTGGILEMQMYSAMCASCVPGHFLGTSLHYVYYVVCISAYGVVFVFSIWFVDDWVRLLPLCAALVILVWALLHCFYPSAMLKKGLPSCPSVELGTSPNKGALGDLLFGRGQVANIFEITFFKCKKSYVRSAVCTKCWAESVVCTAKSPILRKHSLELLSAHPRLRSRRHSFKSDKLQLRNSYETL